ncbi:MAG: tartrate-resistant acid phosphatase type 5 [Myxococcota bacterium]|jgi:tartrate-resistant acid phosphatase type 5
MLVLLVLGCSPQATPLTLAPLEPASSDTLRIVALGDTGHRNDTQRRVASAVARVCAERGCDAVILLGDNIYPRGATAPDAPDALASFAPYADLGVPVYAVLGNHDWGHGNDWGAARAQTALAEGLPWLTVQPDWSLHAGPASLFGLDTTRVFWDGAGRTAWMSDAVANARGWRVVLGHHPLLSNGPHGDAGRYEGLPGIPWLSGRSVRTALEDVLCDQADVYLAGHDHSRQWHSQCGVQLIVSGAGSSVTELSPPDPNTRFQAATPGLVWLSLGAVLTIAFHDVDGYLEHEGTLPPPERLAQP